MRTGLRGADSPGQGKIQGSLQNPTRRGDFFGHLQSMLARVLEGVVELPTAIMATVNVSTIKDYSGSPNKCRHSSAAAIGVNAAHIGKERLAKCAL